MNSVQRQRSNAVLGWFGSGLSPDAVQEIVAQAEQKNPSVVERASEFYAQHPTLVKTIGGGALAIVLAKIAQKQSIS